MKVSQQIPLMESLAIQIVSCLFYFSIQCLLFKFPFLVCTFIIYVFFAVNFTFYLLKYVLFLPSSINFLLLCHSFNVNHIFTFSDLSFFMCQLFQSLEGVTDAAIGSSIPFPHWVPLTFESVTLTSVQNFNVYHLRYVKR